MKWREATHQEFLWSISLNAPANVGTQGDTGWVDSLSVSSDIMAVCSPTADFTLVTPVSSPPSPEKMVQCNYLCRTYNTEASFELIFMKYACLMRVHPWMNPTVFGNNRSNRTTDVGKKVPLKPFFWLSFSRYKIFYAKTYRQCLVSYSPQKRFNLFLSFDACFAKKMVVSPKNNFSRLFWKISFFLKKLFNEKYLKPHFLQKRLY